MSCIVYQTDHKTGIKYAYESISYWDKDKQQPRSKRKYLGKVDPDTGEIISKKERSNHSAEKKDKVNIDIIRELNEQLSQKDEEINSLQQQLTDISKKNEKLLKIIAKIEKMAFEAISDQK